MNDHLDFNVSHISDTNGFNRYCKLVLSTVGGTHSTHTNQLTKSIWLIETACMAGHHTND